MKKYLQRFCQSLALLFLLGTQVALAQEAVSGEVFFNYGSSSGSISQYYSSSYTIGQPVVGPYFGVDYQGALGFWSRYLVAPAPPFVTASEGDFPDRILLNWDTDPLSPASDKGFNIYRDGAFLAHLDPGTLQFIDFNVIPGIFYNYEIRGVNSFGDGYPAEVVGFVNPNGLVTGQVTTINDNPVAGVQVTLEPTIGNSLAFDGDDFVQVPYNAKFAENLMTVSCWVKIGANYSNDAIVDFGQDTDNNWWINTSDAGAKGVSIGIGGAASFDIPFTSDPDDWHYIAFTYNGENLNAYLDGELAGSMPASMQIGVHDLFLGRVDAVADAFFDGKLDDFRIYSRQLSQTEIIRTMNATVPSNAPGLEGYWKFDEGLGYKIFDLTENQVDGFITGSVFSADRPNVLNAGITDASGYYVIDGINYGGGQSFTARPNKNFEFNNGLEFNASDKQYATISGFTPSDSTGTIQVWFKPSEFSGKQTIVYNEGLFDLSLQGNDLNLSWDGSSVVTLATLTTTDYVHVTLKYDPAAIPAMVSQVKVLDTPTVIENAFSVTAIDSSTWANTQWILGGPKDTNSDDFFTGIIDEVVFFNNFRHDTLVQFDRLAIDFTDLHLNAYFSLNESVGTAIEDQGPSNLGAGEIFGATWTNVTANPHTVPHEFNPESRIVTLDQSNTSVDNVNFDDISTVAVAGYVRYANTLCFVEEAEILVDNGSHLPPIMTNDQGYYIGDFEPGSSFRLSPNLEGHTFIPNFWDINQIVVPRAGIVFNDQTTRDLTVELVGGPEGCDKSLVAAGDSVVISIETTAQNACFNQTMVVPEGAKKVKFKNVPPMNFNVFLLYHSNSVIKNAFNGRAVNLADADSTITFRYRAPLEVVTSELPLNDCGTPLMEQFTSYQVEVRTYEYYGSHHCELDSMEIEIINPLSAVATIDTSYGEGKFKHKFNAGTPNITGDFMKTITYKVTDPFDNRQATTTVASVVVGKKEQGESFTTGSPDIPLMILRDPPGDASYSFLEEGESLCNSVSMTLQTDKSQEAQITVDLGPEYEVPTSPLSSYQVEHIADFTAGLKTTSTYNSATEKEMCMTALNRISTSGDDAFVGSEMGGDLFMGAAMNFMIGKLKELKFDTLNCSYTLDSSIFVRPEGFETQYIYSEHQLTSQTIPDLFQLGTAKDSASANAWQQIVDYNEELKESAVNVNNISFDHGVIYENTQTIESSSTHTVVSSFQLDKSLAASVGFKFNSVGFQEDISFDFSVNTGRSQTTTISTSNTVGYHLEDNDAGDFFTIDINKDPVYGTPVFKTKSGQSSCPHEPNTQNRFEPAMSCPIPVALNVPETEPAIFDLVLSNVSPTEEARYYYLRYNPATTQGAHVKINGQPVEDIFFQLDYLEEAEVVIEISKGAGNIYDYEDIELFFYTDCEWERAEELGIELDDLFEDKVLLSAHFIEGCSDVEISSPGAGWTILPQDNDLLDITIDGYDLADTDLEMIQMQYRPTNGNGIWVVFDTIPRDSLGPIYEVVKWNVEELSDGDFEIRAQTICTGGLPSGLSTVIPGKLERQAPELVGTPQPSDGILSAADQIYITFSEDIQCGNFTSVTGATENYVILKDASTGLEIAGYDVACIDNQIYITPTIQNEYIENKLLRAEVKGIKDLAGNISGDFEWEFYVDRNPLRWVGGDIVDVKYDGEIWSVTRKIQNVGGQTASFTLEDIPNWLEVSLQSGEIESGGDALIEFTVSEDIANGQYTCTIQLDGIMGEEPLKLDLAVLCPPPVWDINPALFDFNMTFTVELNIEGNVSTDENDLVAAFVGNELRGVASVTYVPSLNKNLAFLNVYSNEIADELVEFRIWDASDCLLYGTVVESYLFANDGLHGNPDNPDVLHTESIVLKEIPIHNGWNWISFNLNMPDKSVGAVLESLEHPTDLLIKDQTSFSQYFDQFGIWAGSLTELGYTSSYQIKGTQNDTIRLLGYVIDPDTVDIPINIGWNWIGYLPQFGQHVNDALSNLNPLPGDIIKNQTSFAQYVTGIGWIGSLTYMEAPNGYLLKSSTEGTLAPESGGTTRDKEGLPLASNSLGTSRSSLWTVNPADYEFSMTMTAIVEHEDLNHLKMGDEVGAFYGDEVRGTAETVYVEALDIHVLFMTIYSNESDQELNFKYYDGATGSVHDLNEKVVFVVNDNLGSIVTPEVFTMLTTSVHDLNNPYYFSVDPNPFRESTMLTFNLGNLLPAEKEATILLYDVVGNILREETVLISAAEQNFELRAVDGTGAELASGVYFIQLRGEHGGITKKVLITR